ncbi:MAG: universal stress protein [Verrucomicrobiota bacterium]|nr:universal stress protein [Verrucomicrobiota bacterium]
MVPTDFSRASQEALEVAHSLGKQFRAALHLVHVVEPEQPMADLVAMPLIVPAIEFRRRVRRHLRDVAHRHGISLANIHVARGRPFEEICRLAKKCGIDLIVTATRGQTGFKHFALGSTAERVVRHSSSPVLVVPARGREKFRRNGHETAASFGKILVPIDFSDCSMKGLAYAKVLAKHFGAKLVLLHSVALRYYVASDEYARYDLPILMQQVERAAQKQLHDLVEKTDGDGIEVESSLQIGHAGEQVCARAKEARADVIVTSTHGATGLKHVLLGSTAEYIVRHAQRPVLVVPDRERRY